MKGAADKSLDKKVVVIGGGPAGLTASYRLSKAGLKSIVLEKDQIVGGLSRTINYKDYYFDIGGHRFFTKIKEVEDMWKEILGDDLLRRKRLSRIYYNKKFFYYPLRVLNAFMGLGMWNSFLILVSYLRAKITPSKQEDTFEQWVSNRFGKRLFNIFFKTYTEKVWGIPCSEIRAEWAAQRIKGLSLLTALRNALIKNRNSTRSKKDVIKTLIDEFYYPKFGPGMMWKMVADDLIRNESELFLGTEVEEIHWSNNKVEAVVVRRNDKKEFLSGTDFICSMPLRETIQKFKPNVPRKVLDAANKLKYRDFLMVALIINEQDIFPDNWIYVHDPDVNVGRIQNFKNWSPFMVPGQDTTCLGLEYFCSEGDFLWNMQDEQLIELAIRESEALGFIYRENVLDGTVVRMPKAYPVYDSTCQESIEIVRQFLDNITNFQLVGRNGQHRYNNQDHSMLTAMMAVDNIRGSSHDLWQVNVEPEYHEEIRLEPGERARWEKIFGVVFAKMDKFSFATALGSVSGILAFLATIFLVIKGGEVVGPNLQLLGQYFVGYSVTVKGAFIGMIYSFIYGFLFGWLFAYIRNFFIAFFIYQVKRKAAMLKFRNFLDNF